MTQSSIYAEDKQRVSAEFVEAVRVAYLAARPKFDSEAYRAYWDDYQAKLGREIIEDDDFE